MSSLEQVTRAARWLMENVGAAPFLLAAALIVPSPLPGGAAVAGIPGLCPTLRVFQVPCPGCGMTRSVVATAHGDLLTALDFHPLGPLVFGWLAWSALSRVPAVRRAMPKVSRRAADRAAAALVVVLLAVWGLRLGGLLPVP